MEAGREGKERLKERETRREYKKAKMGNGVEGDREYGGRTDKREKGRIKKTVERQGIGENMTSKKYDRRKRV